MADGNSLTPHRVAPPVIATFEEKERMAQVFARSGLFGAKTTEQALALILIAEAEGIHPSQAIQEYDIIEGKPARKAERQLARFQMSGGKVEWLCMTEKEVKAKFTHPQGSEVEIAWTIEQAQKVVMYTKDGQKPLTNKLNWRNFPRAMLRARVIAEGVRACFPGYALVTLTTEEAEDLGALNSEPVDDAPPAIAAGGYLKGKAKDEAVEAINAKIAAATTFAALEALKPEIEALASRVSKNAAYGLEEAYAQREHALGQATEAKAYAEHVADADPVLAILNGQEPEAGSPFEGFKEALLGVPALPEEERDAAFEAVAASLTQEALAACSDREREELRTIYRNVKAEIRP